jgi:hypothetical protein
MSEETFCAPHYRRTGRKIPATRVIEGEPMCGGCFSGGSIRHGEEIGGGDYGGHGRAAQATVHANQRRGRGSVLGETFARLRSRRAR